MVGALVNLNFTFYGADYLVSYLKELEQIYDFDILFDAQNINQAYDELTGHPYRVLQEYSKNYNPNFEYSEFVENGYTLVEIIEDILVDDFNMTYGRDAFVVYDNDCIFNSILFETGVSDNIYFYIKKIFS